MSPKLLVGAVLLGILVIVLGGADTAHAQTFEPTLDITLDDPRPLASSDVVVEFNLPEGDVNFAGLVSFIPGEWTVTPGDQTPVGTVVGILESLATLGLINAACNNVLPVRFEMLNGSIDINDNVEFEDTDDNLEVDFAEDKDGNGLKDAVDRYPSFINRVLTDEDDNPLQPIRRSVGTTIVAGVDVLLQFLVFEPGTFINENIPSGEELGYPSVTLLQNIGDPDVDPVPSAITDFCAPLLTSNLTIGLADACNGLVDDDEDGVINDGCPAIGTSESLAETLDGSEPCSNADDNDRNEDLDTSRAAGEGEKARINDGCPQVGETSEGDIQHVLFRNASEPGTYTFTTIAVGQRDADGDGIENSLDTCPFVANLGDPRVQGDEDVDNDGLDAACDPNDDETNSDQDLDGYVNRQDNCPLDPNGENEDNQADEEPDGIGDACDPNPNNEDTEGELIVVILEEEITLEGEAAVVLDDGADEGDGGGGGTAIIIVIVVIGAVVVVGGGAFFFLRRASGGGAAGGTPS